MTPERQRALAGDGRATWVAARSRNALRRPALVGTVGVSVFVATLVTFVVVPREAHRAAGAVAPRADERPDTARLVAALDH